MPVASARGVAVAALTTESIAAAVSSFSSVAGDADAQTLQKFLTEMMERVSSTRYQLFERYTVTAPLRPR